jgi:hypothetical protein
MFHFFNIIIQTTGIFQMVILIGRISATEKHAMAQAECLENTPAFEPLFLSLQTVFSAPGLSLLCHRFADASL